MDFAEWTTPATTAFDIALTRHGKNVLSEPFAPELTYFLFDKTEDQIFGYKQPRIAISFRASDMKPSVKISYKQKIRIDLPGADQFVDLEKLLGPFFPADAFTNAPVNENAPFTPPGSLLFNYSYEGSQFEIWNAPLSDRQAIQIVKNMKILIPMYIEGGTVTFLDDDDNDEERWAINRWQVFLLYQKSGNNYTLTGFSTSYRFDTMPMVDSPVEPIAEDLELNNIIPAAPSEPPTNSVRERISQFLILPPFQHQPHGIRLYQTMMKIFLSKPYIFEVTVEDPNEHFDNLRDYCDFATLLADPTFRKLYPISSLPPDTPLKPDSPVPITAMIPKSILTTLCANHKLIDRQVARLIELYLLSQIPVSNRSRTRIMARKSASVNAEDRKFYFWRLLVKQRVFLRNKEELQEFDESERIERIESSVDSLLEHYVQLIEGFEKRVDRGWLKDARQENSQTGAGRTLVNGAPRKRKVVESSESEDEPSTKRQATEPLE
jgi:histone acetyltransferase 1